MTGNERLISALKFQKVDRVPVVPKIWVDFAARVTKTPIVDVIQDPVKAFRVIAQAGEQLGLDAVRQFTFPKKYIVEKDNEVYEQKDERIIGKIDLSGGLSTHLFEKEDYRIDDPATIAYCHSWTTNEPLVNSVTDAKQIAVPDKDVFDELGWARDQKLVIDEFGDSLSFIGDCDSATMSFYITFRGLTNAMFDLITEPKMVHAVMKKGAEIAISRGKYWLDNGLRVLRLNDSTGNMSLISPDHWREFVYPYIKEVCDELHNYNSDAILYCHICGNILPIAEDLINAGLDCIGPLDPLGGFTVKQVRDIAGERASLMGGVNTLTLLNGTYDEVKNEAVKCIQEAQDGLGFVLGSGCVVPRGCPVENLRALTDASKEYASQTSLASVSE